MQWGKFAIGAVVGAVVAAPVVGVLGGVVSYGWVKKSEADVRRGWDLTPVVVMARDARAGTQVGFDDISQRSIPGALVTASDVMPDSASYTISQVLTVDVYKSEPLRWAMFASTNGGDRKLLPLYEACEAEIAKTVPVPDLSAHAIRARMGGK